MEFVFGAIGFSILCYVVFLIFKSFESKESKKDE